MTISIITSCIVAKDEFIRGQGGHRYPTAASHITPRQFVSASQRQPARDADSVAAIVARYKATRRTPGSIKAACSQCGGEFPASPGTYGFSHCEQHRRS